MSKFKVGDRVRRTGVTYNEVVNGQEYVISSIDQFSSHGIYLEGMGASYSDKYFELATPVEPTDKELADEYRALRAKATEIGGKLIERGYKPEVKLSIYGGWTDAPFFEAPEYRFTKTVTTTEEV